MPFSAKSSIQEFSAMSLIQKEAYCENLLTSEEYLMLMDKLSLLEITSLTALEDESFYRITTDSDFLVWISNNLIYTKFSSVSEAKKTFKKIEQLRKDIHQKFPAMNFNEKSDDIQFLIDYSVRHTNTMYLLDTDGYFNCVNTANMNLAFARGACAQAYVANSNIFEYAQCTGAAEMAHAVATAKCVHSPVD
jgi:hypothetical protein